MSEDAPVEEVDEQPEGCEPSNDPEWMVSEDHFRLLSVNVNFRSGHPGFTETVRWHMEPFLHHKAEPESITVDLYPLQEEHDGDRWFGYEHIGEKVRKGPLPDLLNHALWHLHAIVPKRAGDMLFLHAGAVERDGAAVLLPAMRDAGKSTTVAALLEAGFSYLSDELGAIDPISDRAYPFPKRISLDEDSLRFFPGIAERLSDREGAGRWLYQRYLRPEDLGSTAGRAAPVRSIVFLSPDHDGPARLDPMPQSEAVHAMATHCFNLYRYEGRGVILLSRVAAEARTYRLAGGTPQERAALLSERLTPH